MKATVKITKSFDNGREFVRDWVIGDFEDFFTEEGQYLDRLSDITEQHAMNGESFTVTYTVTVEK